MKFIWKCQLSLIKIDDVIQKTELHSSCPNALTSGSHIHFLLIFGLENRMPSRLKLSLGNVIVIMKETAWSRHISLFKVLIWETEPLRAEHLNRVYPILDVFLFSFRAQPYDVTSNHTDVMDGEFLLLLHGRHFWIIVKAASSECKEKQNRKQVNIFSTVTTL